MSEEFTVFKYGIEILDEMIRYHLGEALFFGAAGAGIYALHQYNTAKIFHSGKFDGPTAILQTTSYDPAYIKNPETGNLELLINPETGKNFRDQKIRTEQTPISIGNFFDKEISSKLVKYFNRAAEMATMESPIIFMHLGKVLPERNKDKIQELIKNSVQNYISGLYRKTDQILVDELAPNEFFETRTILPLLVKEEGARGWQYRILLLKLNKEGTIDLPDERDVRFFMPDGSYVSGSDSLEKDRYKTLQIIKRYLDWPPTKEILMGYAVELPTGRKISIGMPAAAPV